MIQGQRVRYSRSVTSLFSFFLFDPFHFSSLLLVSFCPDEFKDRWIKVDRADHLIADSFVLKRDHRPGLEEVQPLFFANGALTPILPRLGSLAEDSVQSPIPIRDPRCGSRPCGCVGYSTAFRELRQRHEVDNSTQPSYC